MVTNESQENEMRKPTQRTWEKVLKQPLRAQRTNARRRERETLSNPLVLISKEKGHEPEMPQVQPVSESPPREPGFIYEETDDKRRLPIKLDKGERSKPPFMKFSPYLKQLTFGPVLPPPGFEGLYQPPPPPEPLPKFPPSLPTLAPLSQEVPAPPPPPQQMPVNPFISPPVDFTRFFNETNSSSSSNGSMF
ncbi:PREDICTED: proline-rich extensin-like protein EPR1 [Ipomoea nil]|uniref:proline-rich extensin-like protein EPR1 n=1 Tax=Ipomoea nil TaxID=35883 RepID=UPI000900EEE7|nr:PREDICTED: proline-rich extensin-like protein EPR1 [Ipomoea nil]